MSEGSRKGSVDRRKGAKLDTGVKDIGRGLAGGARATVIKKGVGSDD